MSRKVKNPRLLPINEFFRKDDTKKESGSELIDELLNAIEARRKLIKPEVFKTTHRPQ